MTRKRPVVLCLSGHDPSGGAGIQADIEALLSHRCHPCSVITALTEQDTGNVYRLKPQRPEDVLAQAQRILNDMQVDSIKIGLLGHAETAQAIAEILHRHPAIPVVLDPVLAAGGGASLANGDLLQAILQLLPLCTIVTPNSEEARKLAPDADSLEQCGAELSTTGCDYVLITGTHENTASVSNRLFQQGRCIETFTWNRLPESYHGSGCTLAAAIAALLAQRLDPVHAIQEAQEYTWNSLAAGYRPSQRQHLPNRLYWMDEEL